MLRKSFIPLFTLAVAWADLGSAARADQVVPLEAYPSIASLRHGNANKVAVGKFNSLPAARAFFPAARNQTGRASSYLPEGDRG